MRKTISDTLNAFFLLRTGREKNELPSDIYLISLILLITKPTADLVALWENWRRSPEI